MSVKKLMAALLAVAMMATVAGCGGKDMSWVASLGETKISAGVYSLNVMTALSEASYKSGVAIDPDKNEIFAADIEGKTGSQFIIEYAQNETRRQLASDTKFTAMGLSLSEEEVKTYTDYAKQMYASDPEMFSAMGVSEESVIEYNRYSYQAYTLFAKVYGEGGEKAAPEAEVIKNFADTYSLAYVVPYLKMDQTTGAALAEADLAKVRAEADKALADITGGKSIVDVIHEQAVAQTPEGSAAIERGEDGEYMMVVDKGNEGYFPTVLTDYLKTGTIGDTKMIEDDQFIMIVQRLDENKPDMKLANYYYSQALPQLKNDEYLELCLSWATELGITFNEPAVQHYTGEKIKKDTDAYMKKVQAAQSSSQAATNTPQLSLPDVSASSSDSAAPESSSDTGSSSSAG